MEEKIRQSIRNHFAEEQIEQMKILGDKVIVTIASDVDDAEKSAMLKAELEQIDGIKRATIVFTKEKKSASLKPEPEKWIVPGVKKIIGVASGKGGVGKSTTATNLALALSNCGLKTALFDADIYGPSIPTMLGYEGQPAYSIDGKNFEPFDFMGIKSMSIGTLVGRDTPLIWRGAKACGAIEQLLTQTNWGEIDVMVIDMPPGTGDIQITLSQRIKLDGIVIVSTPQDIALIDAVKGVNMFKKVDVPILGIVENMSYFKCPNCNEKHYIYGKSDIRAVAERYGIKNVAEIPIDTKLSSAVDAGMVELFSGNWLDSMFEEIEKI